MTIFVRHSHPIPKYELSSRPERSEVEGPAVASSSIKYKWKRAPSTLCHPERSRGICSSLHRPQMHRESTSLTFVIPTGAQRIVVDPLLKPNFQSAQNSQPDLTLAKLSLVESAKYAVRQAGFLTNLDSSEAQTSLRD